VAVAQPSRKTEWMPAASASAIQVATQRSRRSWYFQPLKAPMRIRVMIPSKYKISNPKSEILNKFKAENTNVPNPVFDLSSLNFEFV
jgi:hypothetical protein